MTFATFKGQPGLVLYCLAANRVENDLELSGSGASQVAEEGGR